MITAIIWTEWKRCRRLFVAFLVAAIAVPVIPAQALPDAGAAARELTRSVWLLFSFLPGWIFYEQKRHATLPFLLARPATKPFSIGIQCFSYLTMLAALVIASLSLHFLHMFLRVPGFSALNVLLGPDLFLGLILCLLVFSFSLFLAISALSFGFTAFGIGLFFILLALTISLEQVAHLVSRWIILAPVESPAAFLMICICAGVILGTLSLWMLSFGEIRDARNRRWIGTVALASILSLVLVAGTIRTVAQAVRNPTAAAKVREIIVTGNVKYPVVGMLSDGSDEGFMFTIENPASLEKLGKFMGRGKDNFRLVRNLNRGDQSFLFAFAMDFPGNFFWRRSSWTFPNLAYFSDTPLWGQEIRLLNLENTRVLRISPRDYSRNETLGLPFLSPDGDRVAYVKVSAPRLRNESSESLWITKSRRRPISGSLDLSNDVDKTAAAAGWTPIGWTPDGYDFLLRKTGPEGPEIWAVDWVATGVRRFLPEFSDSVVAEEDLPKAGEWISLITRDAGSKWGLWLVNYRSGENRRLGVFEDAPVRAWSKFGGWFACWAPEKGLSIHSISDGIRLRAACPRLPSIRQMKWAPLATKLAIVTVKTGPTEEISNLALLDPGGCDTTPLVEGFRANERQWGWLSDSALVYADGGELWQADADGDLTLLFSSASFLEER
ncbi:MAG: hypothetical protein JSV16_10650 [Candidatus Hydrogenedentota bacterium]|nr:MAG: hypothetical protein JSV16_10650 [Candidatus Hydrogenedentota bacterium]